MSDKINASAGSTAADDTALIALDWGTSSLRAWRLSADGTVLEQRQQPWGILRLPDGGFPAAFAAITAGWQDPSRAAIPAIASGMVGSRQGWQEVGYLRLPLDLGQLAGALAPLAGTGGGVLHLVPGLLDETQPERPDVMRGEETEAVGALERIADRDGEILLVMPGTHCKWVRVSRGIIASFTTYMTGELFGVEMEAVLVGGLEHAGVDCRALVSCEADIAQLALLARLQHRLERAAIGEHPAGIVGADDLVELQQVEVVGLQTRQRRLDLAHRRLRGAAVDLGHQEDLAAVAFLRQRAAEPDLAFPAIIVPAIVAKVDAGIETGMHHADGLVVVHPARLGQVVPAHADKRHRLAGSPQRAILHVRMLRDGRGDRARMRRDVIRNRHGSRLRICRQGSGRRGADTCGHRLDEIATIHTCCSLSGFRRWSFPARARQRRRRHSRYRCSPR